MASLDGWCKCKLSDDKDCRADIMKKDKTMFIELKNSFNTLNCAGRQETINRLITIKKKYPKAYVALGCVNGKNGKSYDKKIDNHDIYELHGESLFEKITGDKTFFNKVLKMVEEITKCYITNDGEIDDEEQKKMLKKILDYESVETDHINKISYTDNDKTDKLDKLDDKHELISKKISKKVLVKGTKQEAPKQIKIDVQPELQQDMPKKIVKKKVVKGIKPKPNPKEESDNEAELIPKSDDNKTKTKTQTS